MWFLLWFYIMALKRVYVLILNFPAIYLHFLMTITLWWLINTQYNNITITIYGWILLRQRNPTHTALPWTPFPSAVRQSSRLTVSNTLESHWTINSVLILTPIVSTNAASKDSKTHLQTQSTLCCPPPSVTALQKYSSIQTTKLLHLFSHHTVCLQHEQFVQCYMQSFQIHWSSNRLSHLDNRGITPHSIWWWTRPQSIFLSTPIWLQKQQKLNLEQSILLSKLIICLVCKILICKQVISVTCTGVKIIFAPEM